MWQEKWPKTEVAKSQEVVCPTLIKSSQHRCVMVCADAGAHMQLSHGKGRIQSYIVLIEANSS